MKKILFSMLMGMMALGAMAQGSEFKVSGTFEGREDSVALVVVEAASNNTIKEEVFPVTGKLIEMSCELKDAAMLYIVDVDNGAKGYMSVPAIPGEHVIIKKDANNITYFEGSRFYVDYNLAERSIEQPMMALKNFEGECQHKMMSGVPQDVVMKEYEEKAPVLSQALTDAIMAYVKAHPDQGAAAALVSQLDDTDDMEDVAALLTERARGSVAANLYKGMLAAEQKEREEEARQEGMVGSPAPDFTLNDINGKPLALSSLRGKWVIIDFWGSWCKWCIKGIPEMKEYYAKYNDKLEILGVDCNDTVEKWKAAVKQYELPWLHVYWDKDDEENNPLALYGVRGFPTKVIVDPQGNVAKVIVGEDPAFYDYLDQVLK